MISNKFFKAFHSFSLILVSCILLSSWSLFAQSNSVSTKKWVGTWSTAPQLVETGNMPPSPGLTNNSLRQIVRVSIGGDTVRLRISNEFSTSAVTMKSVQIAVSTGGNSINVSTNKELKFNSNSEVTMNAGAAVISDPIAFNLAPRMDVAITIYFGQTSTTTTGHPGSRTTSYLLAGNTTSITDFTGAVLTDHWYNINTIDVLAPSASACVAVLGNSITDGRGTTTNLQNRWTDIMSERLLSNPGTQHVGVLNLGIGGNCLLGNCLGPSGVSRFERDILDQQGIRWAVVFMGVNDIGGVKTADAATSTANNLITAFKQMIVNAHARNIRIYGGTILPFNGSSYYNQYSDICRISVNEWIRTGGYYDGVIDFDKAIRNPQDTSRLVSTYQNDGLHPDAAGYKSMGEFIDLNLFTGSDTIFEAEDKTGTEANWLEAECTAVGTKFNKISDAGASNGSYVTVQPGFNSAASAPSDSASAISIPFTVTKDSTYYIFARLNCATANDDSYWVKLDNSSFEMVNGLSTSGWTWLKLTSSILTKGNHTLTIAYREDGANLDKLCITNYMYPPMGMGDAAGNTCVPNTPTGGINLTDAIDGYVLGQNSPNPFNNKTTIEFEIPKDCYVSLKVYNMHGVEMAELAGKKYTKGKHTVEFDSKNLSKGIYFYTFKADKFRASRKMICA